MSYIPFAIITACSLFLVWSVIDFYRSPRRQEGCQCFCPGCGKDLCAATGPTLAWGYTETEEVWYVCACGTYSTWYFDAPVPILTAHKKESERD